MSYAPNGGQGNGQPGVFPNGFMPQPNMAMPPGMPMMPGMPPMMPIPGMPGMPPMSMFPGAMPGMMPPVPNISYPAGQGPLANRPVTVGANGLYNAPEEEGPGEHEGMQFLQLNVAEGVKYGEYWVDASEGNETVSRTQLFEFMQRASKVSKSQLRTIWEIADHRKEGQLDRDEFFIALRLLALGQRGAELSMKGLRNFVGIQLIPQVSPREPKPPAAAPATPTAAAAIPGSGNTAASTFSWTVPAELIGRYDRFFDGLDLARSGIVDGKQGFTFFSKSGLPRPTLRRIWQLADITADGKLDREEFRQAMHLVTGVKNGRISVEQLPERLHPSTPFWLRVVGAPAPAPLPENNNINIIAAQAPPPPPPSDPPPPPPPDAVSSDRSYSDYSNHASPIVKGMPGMGSMGGMGMGGIPNMPLAQQNMQSQPLSPSMATRMGSEADEVRAQLQRERMEADKVRREMEGMQAELEKVRLEKQESLKMRQQFEEMAAAKRKAEEEAAKAKAELVKTKIERTRSNASTPAHTPKLAPQPPTPVGQLVEPIPNVHQAPPAPPQAQNPLSLDALSKAYAKAPPPATKIEDDDIWNEPSPEIKQSKAPAGSGGLAAMNVGPSAVPPNKTTMAAKDVDYSSDEDDDDFWGMGSKPTLGGNSTATGKANGNTAAGGHNQLDDWLF